MQVQQEQSFQQSREELDFTSIQDIITLKSMDTHSRDFKTAIFASFISQTGSYFLTLALSVFILQSSGSLVFAGLVFVVSFLPSIFVSSTLGHWVDLNISRWLYARNELISIITTILCGLIIYFKLSIVILCLVLALRSVLTFVSRSAALKWIKLISPPELQVSRNKIYFLGYFLAIVAAGLCVVQILPHATIVTTAFLDAISYIASAGLILTARPIQKQNNSASNIESSGFTLNQTLREIFKVKELKVSFFLTTASVVLFQSAYQVLITYLPLEHFHMGIKGVGQFQLAQGAGLVAGFIAAWFLDRQLTEKSVYPFKAVGILILGLLALELSVTVQDYHQSILAFFGFNLFMEAVFIVHNSAFFKNSPRAYLARFSFVQGAFAASLMSVATLGYSLAIPHFGLPWGLAINLILFIGILIGMSLVF